MTSTIRRVALAALAIVMTGSGVAAATSGSDHRAHSTRTHVVKTVGGEIFKPNVSDTFTMRFLPGDVRVHRGDTIVFAKGDMGSDPHSVSIVAARDRPLRTEPCPACDPVEKAHFPHGQSQPPLPAVNVGKPGFDQPGDSIVWMTGRASVKVSARAGTVLHYFCALHPWMQGTITVVK